MLRIIIFSIVGSFLFHQVLAKQKCSPWAVQSNCSAIGPACICEANITIDGLFSCEKQTLANGVCLILTLQCTNDRLLFTRTFVITVTATYIINTATQGSDNDSAIYGYCPYTRKIYGKLDIMDYGNIYFPRARTVQPDELNDLVCESLNRQDILCSRCKPGYGPAVHAFGFMCADCDEHFSGWGLYLFLQLFPLTVFYAIVIIFHVQAASPPLISFVLLCQTYQQTERSNEFVRTHIEKFAHPIRIKIAQTLCGFWNLDFFRHIIPSFCVDSRLNNLHALWLDFISAYYPLLLIFITYVAIELHARNFKPIVILWRPFHKCCVRIRGGLDPKSSIINAFTTFLVLSIGKIIFLSVHSVYTTHAHHLKVVKHGNGTYKTTLYYDPKLFLGHFKNGTDGSRDYRAFSGIYIILQVLIGMSYLSTFNRIGGPKLDHYYLPTALFLTVILFSNTHPYKRKWNNYLTVTNFILMLINFSGFTLIPWGIDPGPVYKINIYILNIILILPHIVLYSYALYKAAKNLGITNYLRVVLMMPITKIKMFCFLKTRHIGYEQLQGVKNLFLTDWRIHSFINERMECTYPIQLLSLFNTCSVCYHTHVTI